MVERIYIETTIPSAYYTLRTDPESIARMNWTREWWDTHKPTYQVFTSVAVTFELDRGQRDVTEDRIRLLDGIERLPVTEEVRELARLYIERKVMPNDPSGDALHLAIASIHKADFLLTWNCRHLANVNKAQHMRLVNYELGLSTPTITTPMNFLSGGNSDD